MGFSMYDPAPHMEGGTKEDRQLKRGAFGKLCVILSLSFCGLYTIASLVVFWVLGVEPSTLTTCVFAFFGSELLALGTIRVAKNITENKKGRDADAKIDPAHQQNGGGHGV